MPPPPNFPLRCAAALTATFASAAPAAAETLPAEPAQIVTAYHAGLLGVMKKAKRLGFDGRAAALTPVVGRAFDLPYLSRRIIGGKAWRALPKDRRTAYVAAFSRFTVAAYASRFKGYSGETFVTLGAGKVAGKFVLVRTALVKADGAEVPLNYLMQKRRGAWKAIDIYLKGAISEVATRRAEFRAILRRSGMDGLIRAIEQKTRAARTPG